MVAVAAVEAMVVVVITDTQMGMLNLRCNQYYGILERSTSHIEHWASARVESVLDIRIEPFDSAEYKATRSRTSYIVLDTFTRYFAQIADKL